MRKLALFLLGAVALAGCSGSHTASAAERSAVVVLSRHVRHQADLASLTAARATGTDGGAIAQAAASKTSAVAAELDAVLASWHVSTAEADRLFAVATAGIPDVTGVPMYACSLRGPIDDVGQLDAASPAQVGQRWAQLTMTSAIEGLRLASDAHTASFDSVQRDLLRDVAPLLPVTDRRLALAYSSS